MNEDLKYIFGNVNEWLKFAEAKNAALFVAVVGGLTGMASLAWNVSSNSCYLQIYFVLSASLFFVSALVCLFSFPPLISIPFTENSPNQVESDNLLFFGDLSKYTGISLFSKLQIKGVTLNSDSPSLDLDLANQIVVNSKIALFKYKSFKVGCWFTIAAVITPILAFGLFMFLKNQRGENADR